MAFVIVLAALCFLMLVAYRGYSVILFAPVAALGAVLLTDPRWCAVFTGLFMDKMVGFLQAVLPGVPARRVFGKVIELSGFSARSSAPDRLLGRGARCCRSCWCARC
jgi:H+/gluconate symporter-like permease